MVTVTKYTKLPWLIDQGTFCLCKRTFGPIRELTSSCKGISYKNKGIFASAWELFASARELPGKIGGVFLFVRELIANVREIVREIRELFDTTGELISFARLQTGPVSLQT